MLLFSIVTTVTCTFLSVMCKSLYAVLIEICIVFWNVTCLSHCCQHCWNASPTTLLCSHLLFSSYKRSARINECQWVLFFPHGEIQWLSCASYILPYQMPFCQAAPLLPSITRQKHVTGYCWEGSFSAAVPTASDSDVLGQQNKIGDVTFGAALVYGICVILIRDFKIFFGRFPKHVTQEYLLISRNFNNGL